ncbi:unnamed protein product [Anisakis simplex]|uniref:Liprin-beta (inferred by orthology to a C. elegans protein) n=1 Tax=Anisakis simplex TaxID=6269 RepID=A0A0M3JYP6_ANISI|nr:unnamed protein product [Anisakis simplex]
MSTVSCPEYPELQEKLHRLAMARDSLSLQVTVLTEQVGAQKEKIRDLESLLTSKRHKLDSTEELLQDHADNRGDLESKKLDLLAEVSNLKLKYATLEREKLETERKLRLSQAEIEHLNESMQGFMMQQHQLHNAHLQVQCPFPHAIPTEPTAIRMDPESASEMEQLRMAVQRLIVDNEQKNIQINSLRNALDEHCRNERDMAVSTVASAANFINMPSSATYIIPQKQFVYQNQQPPMVNNTNNLNNQLSNFYNDSINSQQQQPFDINVQLRKLLIDDVNDHMAHSSSFPTSLCGVQQPNNAASSSSRTTSAVQSSSSYTSSLSAASPQHSCSNSGTPRHQQNHNQSSSGSSSVLINNIVASTSSPVPGPSAPQSYRSPSSPAARQLAAELDELRRIGGDLQQHHLQNNSSNAFSTMSLPRSLSATKAVSAYTLPRKKLSMTSSSGGISGELDDLTVMNILNDQNDFNNVESDDEIMRRQRTQTASVENSKMKRDKTRSSLRNLLGKLTRSSSQEIRSAEFRRGSATRSTTMARLPSVGPVCGAIAVRPPVEQFVEWNTEQICEWMAEIGFSVYVPEVERFVRSGRHLLTMSNHDFDKELLMRNPLHRKRLRCILKNIDKGVADAADRMDVHQVLRWLDEIGLPQYRENFAENMIDGQLLTTLTAQDLVEDVLNKGPCPNEVERWSHHCTCQWLKTIDLAEFTPNLLCAGIHGALMVYEPTFTAESLAEVLQMPAHKTLIRRHLATHFNQLLGQEIISHKRDILAQPFVAQLTPALRIRLMKKGFSLSRKKGKNEVFVEPEELVCPPLTAKSKYLQHHQQQYVSSDFPFVGHLRTEESRIA